MGSGWVWWVWGWDFGVGVGQIGFGAWRVDFLAQTNQAGTSTNEAGGREHAHKRSRRTRARAQTKQRARAHRGPLVNSALDPVLMVCTASLEHWFVKASTSGDDVNGGAAAVWYKTM